MQTPRRRKFWLSRTTTILVVVALALFLKYKPPGLKLPGCPFRDLTGLYCPGCGSTRAIRKALQGEFLDAFRYNPITLPFLFVILYLYALYLIDQWTGNYKYRPSRYWIGLVAVVLFVALMVLRNVPWSALDFLRPPGTF